MRPRFERPDTLFAHQLLAGDVVEITRGGEYDVPTQHTLAGAKRINRGRQVQLTDAYGSSRVVDADARIRTISRVERYTPTRRPR